MNGPDLFPPQPQGYTIPPVTQPARVWSLGFISIILLIALLGGSLAFFGVSAMAQNPYIVIDFYPGNLITLIFQVGLLSACLAALWFAPAWLLRAGLLLQVGAAAANILSMLFFLQIIKITPSSTLDFSLDLLERVLNYKQ